jgi:hypothetical protein
LIESLINIAIGAVVSFLSQLLIFPLFAIDVTLSANLGITAWFTAVSHCKLCGRTGSNG